MTIHPPDTASDTPEQDRFIWPPKQAAPDELPTPPLRHRSAAPVPTRARRTSLLETVEQEWLDLTSEPVAQRIAAGRWTPDPIDAYCHRCGRTVGPHEASDDGCGSCRGTRPPWSRFIRLGVHESALQEMIVEVKFTRFRRLGHDLGRLLGQAVLAHVAHASPRLEQPPLIVPVPTTTRRRLSRGIDHTTVIARGAASQIGVAIAPVLRRRHVPSQLMVAASRRAANVAGTMRLRRGRASRLSGALVVVLDDVCTTGATMRAACRAVRDGVRSAGFDPPLIWAATIARATPDA